MIVFRGILSLNTQRYLSKKLAKITCISSMLTFLFFGIPSILIGIYFSKWLIFVLFLIFEIWMITFMRGGLANIRPTRISIDEKEILGEFREGVAVRALNDVKKVLDFGEFYHFIFYSPKQWSNCVCQKDLIIEGTIEEFEERFKDKIERKYEINQ